MSVSNSSISVDCLEELNKNVFIDSPILSAKELQKQERDSERQLKKFIADRDRNQKKQEKFDIAQEKKRIVNENKISKQKPSLVDLSNDETNSLFDRNGTELQGKTKLELLQKIGQYKNLFKDELKTFKIKKTANEEELNLSLIEMQTIVELGSVDSFLMESVYSVIKAIEVGTSNTNYNLSGLSVLLAQNKEFSKLMKVMFCKYGTFGKIPVELQLILIVGTTAMICVNKNKNKNQINQFLDENIQK